MFTYRGITFSPEEILVYLRKSRADDPLMTVEETLQKHEDILDEWALKNLGAKIPEENKFREVVSGETIQARPEFQKVLRLIEGKNFKAVLIKDCSRLGRPDLETIGRITNLFRYTKTFIFTQELAFDLTDEFGRERLKMELEHSSWYLEAYKKLNKVGREQSVRSGYFIGSIPPYGYDKDFILVERKKRPTLKINEHESGAVRTAFDMYVNTNNGFTNIAHELNKLGYKTRSGKTWSAATIKDMIANVHYIGKVKWGWRETVTVVEDGEIVKTRPKSSTYSVYDGVHPAIIDEETFERARAKQGKNHRAKASTQLVNPLAGIVYCQCGRAMTYRTYKDTDGKERCAPRLLCDNQTYCHTQSVTFDEMLLKVMEILRCNIADFEIELKNTSGERLANREQNIMRLKSQLDELDKKELSLWEKYSEEKMPKAVFDKLNEKVLQEKETITKALENVEQTQLTIADYRERITRFYDALTALEDKNASPKLQNKLLRDCVEKIVYSREKGTRWNKTEFEIDVELKI